MSAILSFPSSLPTLPSFLSKDLPNTLYTIFVKNIAFLQVQFETLEKYSAPLGVVISSLGTVYSFFSNNSLAQQVFVALGLGCVCVVSVYHQTVLEASLQKAQIARDELKKRLTLTEITLSDRERLIKTLSETAAQLVIVAQFLEGLKDSAGDIKLLKEHLSSIEKVTKTVFTHFKKTDEATALTLQKISHHLEKLHKEDVDKMALLIEIHRLNNEIKEITITTKKLIEEMKEEKTIASKQQLS